ncbi:PilD processed protein [Shewanella mangrovi]|uniref:PilD processed protein n=1 Tax=Shewanella mangrovi TaxID=1515746 RepID=A0A094JB31_9GAMM|nr:type II secretion system protein [Shewanella mangrovi]KFZ36427.1 PilD processed protein [Shewanella mangrovi]
MKTLPAKGRSGGFTLIELVVVIIILGILAVIAAPKFVNMSSDARSMVLRQMQAAVKSANMQVFAKSQMPSFTTQAVANRSDLLDVDLDGNGSFETRLKNGYLDNTDVLQRLDIDEDKLAHQEENSDNLYIGYDLNGDSNVNDDQCYFLYTQAADSTTPPVYSIENSGC